MTTATPLPKCDQQMCPGHLGKFDSCRDEALYLASMDGGDNDTGDVDYQGHFTLMILEYPLEVDANDFGAGHYVIRVPAGNYIVQAHTSGNVSVASYDTELLARMDFESHERDFAQWCDDYSDDLPVIGAVMPGDPEWVNGTPMPYVRPENVL